MMSSFRGDPPGYVTWRMSSQRFQNWKNAKGTCGEINIDQHFCTCVRIRFEDWSWCSIVDFVHHFLTAVVQL